jgi:S1-C subfamily serine protease
VTNAHVVEGASVVKIAQADSTRLRPARVVGRSPCDDLAVLQAETTAGLQAARLGESSAMKAGADVVALGYPLSFDLGTDLSVNAGNISQVNAQLSKFESLIKIDAAINPGNSGGPLVNRFGEVIGINSIGIAGAQNQNYAIAISRAKPIIHQLEEGQDRHYIGLNLAPNEYAEYFGTSDGMAIIAVASGSPAALRGVQPADLLLKLEGKAIDDEETVCDILRSHAPGDRLRLTVFRADTGELLEGEVTMDRTGASDASANKLVVIGVVEAEDDAGEQAAAEAEDDAGEQAAAEPDVGQQDAPQQDASAVCSTATVTGVESLAIRAQPTRSSAMLGEVAGGGMVDVLCGDPIEADGRMWLAVRHGAIEGYMSARYLQ